MSRASLFGLYELSRDGTVLYSRGRDEGGLANVATEAIGRNYFHEIAPFENTADLNMHFKRFLSGSRSADTFVFDRLLDSVVVRTKVFMARAFELDLQHSGGIVVMDIRQFGK